MFDLLESIGGCVLYHDYRSGSFRDWSGNGNHGTPTNANLDRGGCNFPTQTSNVAVSYSASLNIGAAGAASFLCLLPQEYESKSGSQQRIFDANSVFSSYFDAAGDTFYFLVAGTQKSALIPNDDLNKSRGFGLSWTDGNIPDLYLNGVYGYQIGTALSTGTTDQDLYIGNRASDDRSLMQKMSALVIFNKALTATQHAQLYEALAAARWPTKVYSHARSYLAIDGAEAGLVLGLDMVKVGDTVYDKSPNQNDGNQAKTYTVVDGFARGLLFDGVGSEIDVVDDTSLRVASGGITISAWLKFNSITGFGPILAKGNAATDQNYYLRNDDGKLEFYFRDLTDTANTQWQTTADPFEAGLMYHVVFRHTFGDASSTEARINGAVEAGSWVSGDGNDLPLPNTVDPVLIGERSDYFDGVMYKLEFFTEYKSDAWVAAEYAKGAKTVAFKTAWGARETSANVTGGNITNTPIEVVSGTWSIGTESVNGEQCKVLTCVASGAVAIPTGLFKSGNLDAARGTFDFWLYKERTSNATRVGIIGDQKTAPFTSGYDGYVAQIGSDDGFEFYRVTNGGGSRLMYTGGSYVSLRIWSKFTITRSTQGVFTAYMNDVQIDLSGGSGTNPVTDATYINSKFLVIDPDAGDKIALGAIDGSNTITKYLGVV